MAAYSGLGERLFGQVWMALIGVAASVGVPDVDASRDFIRRQVAASAATVTQPGSMAGGGGSGPPPGLPSAAHMDGIVQAFVAAFRRASEIANQFVRPFLSHVYSGDENAFETIKDNLIFPMLEQIAKTEGGGDMTGPIQQIISGFNGLTNAAMDGGGDVTM